jgi:hypothetical protein
MTSPRERGDPFLVECFKLSYLLQSHRALDLFLLELERLDATHPARAPLIQLAQALILARDAGGERALDALELISPLPDPELEGLRLAWRLMSLRGELLGARGPALLADLGLWAARHPEVAPIARRFHECQGYLDFSAGRFEAAAAGFERAIACAEPHQQLIPMSSLGDSLLESFALERVEALAGAPARARAGSSAIPTPRRAANTSRAPRATVASSRRRSMRSSCRRRGALHSPRLEALLVLTEAAIGVAARITAVARAGRAGAGALGAAPPALCRGALRGVGARGGGLLRAMTPGSRRSRSRARRRASACRRWGCWRWRGRRWRLRGVSDVAAQALALLPQAHHGAPLEVLSLEEAHAALAATVRVGGGG